MSPRFWGRLRLSGSTRCPPAAPPLPSHSCVNTSPPPKLISPAPTSSCATRSKPVPDPARNFAPCRESWGYERSHHRRHGRAEGFDTGRVMPKVHRVRTITLPMRKICASLPAVALISGGIVLSASAVPAGAVHAGAGTGGQDDPPQDHRPCFYRARRRVAGRDGSSPHVARLDNSNPDLLAVFYVDGHVRAYPGAHKVAKTHLSRLKFPAPATVETWVSDASGDPVLVVMAAPGASLVMELRRLLPDLRRAVGDDRRVLVGFDRGGWSPALFAHMDAEGFDVLTWRKGFAQDVDPDLFTDLTYVDETGRGHQWRVADTTVDLPVAGDDQVFTMRQVSLTVPG